MHRRTLLKTSPLLAASLGASPWLAGCASPQVDDYAGGQPVLDLRKYFNGPVDGWGLFSDRSGRVVKRFHVAMQCRWTGDDGTFEEDFSYADGSRERRVWQVRRLGEGRYSARAGDVVGEASGQERGFAAQWRYTLRVPVNGTPYEFQFDDWMYLVSDTVLLNKARMSKFGVDLGEVTLAFTKR